ncbi:MAG: LysE family translocator [Roseinatronobacter sp.]
MIWACRAATWISALLTSYAYALVVLKVMGGLYLLFLAWKSARAALSSAGAVTLTSAPMRLRRFYLRGVLLHLSNPKAVLGWIAIMALGVRQGMSPMVLLTILGGCGVLGLIIHPGYALVFSTPRAVQLYMRARAWIEGAMAGLFALAGVKLLMARV